MRTNKKMTLKEFTSSFNDYLKDKYFKDGETKKVSYATISRWENSKSEPQREMWEKLANYFNVDVAYLQGLTDFKNQQEAEKISADIIDLINKQQNGEETNLTDNEWFEQFANVAKLASFDDSKIMYQIISLTMPPEEAKKVSENISKTSTAAPELLKKIIKLEKIYSMNFDRKKELSEINEYRIKQFYIALDKLFNDLVENSND